MPTPPRRGFTLVELVVTMAIVAILATIALPSYRQYVIRTNRSAAQQFMLQVGSRQEQFLVDNRDYSDSLEDLGLSAPEEVGEHYEVTLERDEGPPLTYLITATPISGGAQASDGTLTLAGDGSRTPEDKWN